MAEFDAMDDRGYAFRHLRTMWVAFLSDDLNRVLCGTGCMALLERRNFRTDETWDSGGYREVGDPPPEGTDPEIAFIESATRIAVWDGNMQLCAMIDIVTPGERKWHDSGHCFLRRPPVALTYKNLPTVFIDILPPGPLSLFVGSTGREWPEYRREFGAGEELPELIVPVRGADFRVPLARSYARAWASTPEPCWKDLPPLPPPSLADTLLPP